MSAKEYAIEVLNQIPQKKKYDLLVNIFRDREKASTNKLNYIVEGLLNKITLEEYTEFITNINKELLKSCNDNKLKMFFDLFSPNKWGEITILSKLRIENIVKLSIEDACIEYDDEFGHCYDWNICEKSNIAISALDFIDYFNNKDEITNIINKKLYEDENLYKEYFLKYFSKYIDSTFCESDFEEIDDSEDIPF